MPYISVYIHFVWSTKKRTKFLKGSNLRTMVWDHIRENAKKKNIHIDRIGGFCEHCHCLISMDANKSMAEVMKLIKGESAYWINKEKLCDSKFIWQDDYWAVSVGLQDLDRVRLYIENQEYHHTHVKFIDEVDEMVEVYGFEKYSD